MLENEYNLLASPASRSEQAQSILIVCFPYLLFQYLVRIQ
jgi:hypothetical protein